ncbi:hypothetical protein V7S43_012926 [Phytophthora oleae]|uniref:OTU domain-containing protein n=1 Tax=Phytophthora oleae TaxID=2107226 RepID=A0ABD3F9H1_9STRA
MSPDGCKVTGGCPPSDLGAPLETWMAIVGGTPTNVAGTGHCGWLAFYAALLNESNELQEPSPQTAEAARNLKRLVINGMLSNLRDECRLKPEEMEAELRASGSTPREEASLEEKCCALADHYAAQRKQAMRSYMPLNFWVRPAHLKAMAMHARESLYVLDVRQNGATTAQMYAYTDQKLPDGENIETRVNQPMESGMAIQMLQELVGAGALPLVLILRWTEAGNHFQAVTYDQEQHAEYMDQYDEYINARNGILEKYGCSRLDVQPYDRVKTTRAAAKELKIIRRAVKKLKASSNGKVEEEAETRQSTGRNENSQRSALEEPGKDVEPRDTEGKQRTMQPGRQLSSQTAVNESEGGLEKAVKRMVQQQQQIAFGRTQK